MFDSLVICNPLAFQSSYGEILPYLAFTIMAILAGLFSLQLPETLHQKLPDTILEAENLGRSDADETS